MTKTFNHVGHIFSKLNVTISVVNKTCCTLSLMLKGQFLFLDVMFKNNILAIFFKIEISSIRIA